MKKKRAGPVFPFPPSAGRPFMGKKPRVGLPLSTAAVPEAGVVMRGGASAWCWLVLAVTAGTTRADALVPEFACPSGCNSQGYCHDGVCVCYPGWTGPDCTTPAQCPHQCNMQGALAPPQLEHALRAARTAYDHSNARGPTRTPPNSRAQDTASTRAASATRARFASEPTWGSSPRNGRDLHRR